MRISNSLQALCALAALSFPVCLHAQFQNPTPDELKMTDDPKAPGSDAVYLNITETTDDKLGDRSFYVRIKVLQEKGRN